MKSYKIIYNDYIKILHNRNICTIFVLQTKKIKDMKTNDFKAAVDEIRNNGGNRQTMFIKEQWRDREMTIFSYSDGSAEVFENARPFMVFNSTVEAIATINAIQNAYNQEVEASKNNFVSKNFISSGIAACQ